MENPGPTAHAIPAQPKGLGHVAHHPYRGPRTRPMPWHGRTSRPERSGPLALGVLFAPVTWAVGPGWYGTRRWRLSSGSPQSHIFGEATGPYCKDSHQNPSASSLPYALTPARLRLRWPTSLWSVVSDLIKRFFEVCFLGMIHHAGKSSLFGFTQTQQA